MRIILLASLLYLTAPAFAASDKLVVHEWGTFTALQDETGRAIGGININDEPLPRFVHRFGPGITSDDNGGKGITVGHPEVTLRLETPVIYFYPPANADPPLSIDVTATLNGGLLTEFYPDADKNLNGKPSGAVPAHITASTRGGLTWSHVTLGGKVTLPETDSHVWTAPRTVSSSPITVANEAEQYIFYRGVGHLDAPLRVSRTGDGNSIRIYDNRAMDKPLAPLKIGGMWLADFRTDGACAFREISAIPAPLESNIKPQLASFTDADYSNENIGKLRDAMKQSLVAAGLFAQEADAMLDTWKLSYFKSNGQRLFYLVPREWTDEVLPLTFSTPCEVTRVMMGRMELVTPAQHLAARRLVDRKQPLKQQERNVLIQSLGRFGQPLLQDAARELQASKKVM